MSTPTASVLVRKASATSTTISAMLALTQRPDHHPTPIPRGVKLTLKTLAYQATHALRNPKTSDTDNAARVLASLLISQTLAAGGRHPEHAIVIAAGVNAATASVNRASRNAKAGALTHPEHAAVMAALSAFEQQLDEPTLTDVEFDVARDKAERQAINLKA